VTSQPGNQPRRGDAPPPEVNRVLQACEALAARTGDSLDPITRQLRLARQRLDEPMRLAVAGQIKRGKSTLVNALLGKRIAATGQLELTFTISEFCYGSTDAIFVHYKDGTVRGPLPPTALDSLTVRNPERLGELRKIRKVEYALPNDLLRSFRLIDTPGLGSVHVTDAENTMDFLGISAAFASEAERAAMRDTLTAMDRTGADVHRDSMAEVAEAGAVLYLCTRGMHERDLAAVEEFLGPGGARVTPLRAFAVLSRCDELWPPGPGQAGGVKAEDYDPMAAAARIASRYMGKPEIRRLFYTMVPVAGKIGIGARQLRDRHFGWLDELGKDLDTDAALARTLSDAGVFANDEHLPGVRLPRAMRAELIELLGAWGTYLACRYRRDQASGDEVRDELAAASGITRLRDLVISHFGKRAANIKLDQGIQDVAAAIGQSRLRFQLADRQVPRAVDVIGAQIERLRNHDDSAAEFSALSDFYNRELTLSGDDATEFLAALGEFGTTSAARLGLPEGTALPQRRAAAERLVAKWSKREQDPTLSRAGKHAIRTMRQCYDRILAEVKATADHDEPECR
jgi:hypothetical protein